MSSAAGPGTVPAVSKPGQASSEPPDLAATGRPASGPDGQERERARRRAGNLRAVVWLILRPLLAVLVLGSFVTLGLAVRLAAGPIEVTWLVHAVTPVSLVGSAASRSHAASLDVGRAWLGWEGLRTGPGAPVTLRFEDVGIRGPNGSLLDHVDNARVSVAASALVEGRLSIEEIDASGVMLHLRRDAERGLDLGLLPLGQAPRGGSTGPALRWSALARVRVEGLQLSVHDLVVGRDWSVRDVELEGRPASGAGDGIVGRFEATLVLAGRQLLLQGAGAAVRQEAGQQRGGRGRAGDIVWHVTLDPVVPSQLADVLPMLAPLRALALPVAPTLDLRFANGPGQFMELVGATLAARFGGGTVTVGGSRLQVAAGLMRVRASLPEGLGDPVSLQLQQADLQLRVAGNLDQAVSTGPLLHAHGTLAVDSLVQARRIRATITLDIPRIGFPGLAQYWPPTAAAGARSWITGNITDGVATGLHVESRLASDQGWAQLAETDRRGGFDASGLTLWWLRPMLPLRQMMAHLSFQGTDAVLVEVSHAVLPVAVAPRPEPALPEHTLMVTGGSMRITGLDAKEQIGTVAVRLSGALGDLLAELAHPRLHLLSKHPVPFGNPSGRVVQADFTVTLPLDDRVTMDQIQVRAAARMQDVHLGDVAAGRSLDQGRLMVSADADGLVVDGDGDIGGIPARLHYAMDFRAGPPSQVVEQAHVTGVVTTEALIREGLDPSRNLAGSGGLTVDYAAHRSGAAEVSLGLDLAGLAISTPIWSKPGGQPARAAAVIGLRQGRLVAIDRIEASGPDLAISAKAEIGNGRVQRIVVARFAVGRTSGAGRLDLPQPVPRGAPPQPIRIQMHGPTLDLSEAIGGVKPAASPPRRGRSGTRGTAAPAGRGELVPWQADLAFDRVFVGRQTAFDGVRAHLEDDGLRIRAARLDVDGPTAVVVRLLPDAGGRRLTGSVADTGRLLQGLDVTAALSGGALQLDGRFDDGLPAHPLTAVATIGRFVVLDAPLAARIVRDLSVYGWFAAPPSPQLGVERAVVPFTLSHGVATLDDARAYSAALGITLRGPVDLDRRTFDLKGTVVPAWAVNRLPGRLPVVGRLFSPEREGGVLAATLTLRGPFDDPSLHVNPLSALVPGALRRLLFQ